MYRHGDVALTHVDVVPNGAVQVFVGKNYTVAEGEVTGHAHRVFAPAVVVWEFGGERFMVVDGESTITHEEHGTKTITPGIYKIGIQKEYDPFAQRIREVVD